ncbi:MAG: hypothetical protein IKE94_11065 [Aeriscardovia sp.]|nr:hypothetical protein [Aeriscardovia sp.]
MGMTEIQKLAKIKVLEDLYKEYELLAKYNGGRDYDRYCALEVSIDTMRKYQMLQADYETRLKADMVAMLTELKKEIEGQCKIPNNCASAYDWNNGVYACYKAVQQKIDTLKEMVEDGKRG